MALPEQLKNPSILRVNNPTIIRNIGRFNLHHICNRVLLNTPRPKIKRQTQDMGHAQSTQPNITIHFFTGSMKHAQRTSLSEYAHRIFYNIYKA